MNRLLNLIEVLFGLMILTLPITLLPKRYQFPVLGGKLPHILLFIGLLSFVAYSLKKHSLSIHGKRYFGGFFIWSLFCLILGVWNFPFYDTVIDDFLRNSKMVVLISEILPSFQYNSSLLHGKMFLSYKNVSFLFLVYVEGFFLSVLWSVFYYCRSVSGR